MSLLNLNRKRRPLSWKPKRQGRRYCSPACGRGCTWAEYQEAIKRAKAMLRLVKGKGWRIDVWENLGWHYRIINGGLQVNENASPFGASSYWCLLSGDESGGGGEMFWSDPECTHHKTIDAAIAAQLKRARRFLGVLNHSFNGLEKRLKH